MKTGFDKEFMLRAIELSKNNMTTNNGGPFGCVIVKNGQIIGEGANQVTSANDPTAHAEVVAIRKACLFLNDFQLTDCDIYTSCEPCPMCLGAIYWARPRIVFYANTKEDAARVHFDDYFIYSELEIEPSKRAISMLHKPHDLALDVFASWASNEKKTEY